MKHRPAAIGGNHDPGSDLSARLKEGKTYEDFGKAWYHTVGFGTGNAMYAVIDAFDPREIIVIGFTETTAENVMAKLKIDVKERK